MPDAASAPTPRLIPLSIGALAALAVDDLATASGHLGIELDPAFVEEGWLWRLRRDQVARTPADLPWLAHVVAVNDRGLGHAGFHAAPDADGAVEIGYWVAPSARRRGLGAACLALVADWGAAAPEVRHLRACVGVNNHASSRLIERAGYTPVVHVVDPDDGDEVIWELTS